MLPAVLKPMLAKPTDAAFDSAAHLFEVKWDGIRCLAFVEARRVRLQSRHGLNLTAQFPELAGLGRLPSGTVLDGELVVGEQGQPLLREIQRRARLQNRHRIEFQSAFNPVTYVVFDIVYCTGQSLLASPLSARRQALQRLLEQWPLPRVLVSEGVRDHGRQLFAQVVRLGLEGMMAKRLDGPYLPGKRSAWWLKIKPKPEMGCASQGVGSEYKR